MPGEVADLHLDVLVGERLLRAASGVLTVASSVRPSAVRTVAVAAPLGLSASSRAFVSARNATTAGSWTVVFREFRQSCRAEQKDTAAQ